MTCIVCIEKYCGFEQLLKVVQVPPKAKRWRRQSCRGICVEFERPAKCWWHWYYIFPFLFLLQAVAVQSPSFNFFHPCLLGYLTADHISLMRPPGALTGSWGGWRTRAHIQRWFATTHRCYDTQCWLCMVVSRCISNRNRSLVDWLDCRKGCNQTDIIKTRGSFWSDQCMTVSPLGVLMTTSWVGCIFHCSFLLLLCCRFVNLRGFCGLAKWSLRKEASSGVVKHTGEFPTKKKQNLARSCRWVTQMCSLFIVSGDARCLIHHSHSTFLSAC